MSSAILPPLFQILTGLSFAALLAIRFLAAPMLRPLWGKFMAFAVLLIALGSLLMSQATAGPTLSAGTQLFVFAGICFFAAALLIVAGFVIAARSGAGVSQS